jgi:hypothetical protein
MGLISFFRGTAALRRRLKGRSPRQKKCARYFFPNETGFFSTVIKDSAFDALVDMEVAGVRGADAIEYLGLDPEQVDEISPVRSRNLHAAPDGDCLTRVGKDGRVRASRHTVTWLLFSSSHLFCYSHVFSMVDDARIVSTGEYAYSDISEFSTVTTTLDTPAAPKKEGFFRRLFGFGRSPGHSETLCMTLPSGRLELTVDSTEGNRRSIKALRHRLREEKTR